MTITPSFGIAVKEMSKNPIKHTLLPKPDIEGTRNTSNTPELFPHLDLGAHRFLFAIASISSILELQMGLELGKAREIINIPSIKFIADVAEALIARPKDGENLEIDFIAKKISKEGDNFSFTAKNKNGEQLEVVFSPFKKIRYFKGRRELPFLNDLEPDEARESLSKTHNDKHGIETIGEIIDSSELEYPKFEIVRENGPQSKSQLLIHFTPDGAKCILRAQDSKTSIKRELTIKLSEFCSENKAREIDSNPRAMTNWLVQVAKEMISKIKIK